MNMEFESYYKKRLNYFQWRNSQNLTNKFILAFFMATITGISAQIIIPLPWTPVPITGQTFAVLISGILLGKYWGGFSQILYLILGIFGIPWFAGSNGGYEAVFTSNIGYLFGFILTALFIGHYVDMNIESRRFRNSLLLMGIGNYLMYIPGLICLNLFLIQSTGVEVGIWKLLSMGLIPFIIGDVIKIICASLFIKVGMPKEEIK